MILLNRPSERQVRDIVTKRTCKQKLLADIKIINVCTVGTNLNFITLII